MQRLELFVFSFADDKDQKKSMKVLAELENIDDECDQNDIAFVKIGKTEGMIQIQFLDNIALKL